MKRRSKGLALLAVLFTTTRLWADTACALCGGKIADVVYFWTDKVANVKRPLCQKCSELTTVCYLCGLPVLKDFKELADGRILCARDLKSVVLDEAEVQRLCQQVKESLDRQFVRFLTFPDNVTIAAADRVNLLEMFKFPGNDFSCPNVLGFAECVTNDGRVSFEVSIMSGMTPAAIRSTAAHELTHTWIFENVSAARKKQLARDAIEGFCELVAYDFVASQNDTAQLDVIKSNGYTRGQFTLFLEAERRFGFNDLVDWMKYGVDARLHGDDLTLVREVNMPARTNPPPQTATATASVTAPTAPATLILKGITWSKTKPLALINDRNFAPNEEGKVRLGQSNVVIRCLAIREDSVVIQVAGASEPQTLRLKTE